MAQKERFETLKVSHMRDLISLLRKLGDFCIGPSFRTKQKTIPNGMVFYLAQKERFETLKVSHMRDLISLLRKLGEVGS